MKNVVFPSELYRVTATEDTVTKNIPVYQTLTGYMRTRDADPVEMEIEDSVLEIFNGLGVNTRCRAKTVKTYYAAHTFQKKTNVEIVLPESVTQIMIKPESAASKVKIEGNRITVSTDETLYFVIQPDGDIFSGLRVLLDRVKPMPKEKKHNLIFTEGIYTVDNCAYIHLNEYGAPVIDGIEDDTLICIGKDAIVNAAIVLKGVRNVEIAGTGILTTINRCHGAEDGFTGEHFWGLFRDHAVPNIHIRSGCENIVVRDILIDAAFRGIILRNSSGVHIENVKIFASTHNADGINCYNSSDLTVNGCFIQSQDDCFCLYNSCDSIPWLYDEGYENVTAVCQNIDFGNCILFTNCRPFVFGGHATGAREPRCLIEQFRIHDCEIIETPALLNPNERFAFYWTSVFRILSQSEQIVRGLTFENIRVDVTSGYCGKVFHLHVRGGSEASYTECRGFAIEDITFRNIEIRNCVNDLYPSVIICRDAEVNETGDLLPHISNVTFENVTIGGRPICKTDFRVEGNVKNLNILSAGNESTMISE